MCAALAVRRRATLDDIGRNMIAATGCVGRQEWSGIISLPAGTSGTSVDPALCYMLLALRRDRHRDCAMYAGRPNGRADLTLPDSAGPAAGCCPGRSAHSS